ncbi:MAG: carboxymuconolactone decarboxylase family protein [Candidatus Binatia bacterium]
MFTSPNRFSANIEACSAPSRLDGKGSPKKKYDELLNFADSDKFTEREKVALTYTSAIAWNSAIADDALWETLHRHFTIPELVELGFFIALTLGQQRWIKTLGIDHGAVLGDTTAGLARAASAD